MNESDGTYKLDIILYKDLAKGIEDGTITDYFIHNPPDTGFTEDNDEYVLWEVINPENQQGLLYGYIPACYVPNEEYLKATTTKYGQYTAWKTNLYSKTLKELLKIKRDYELEYDEEGEEIKKEIGGEKERKDRLLEVIKDANTELDEIFKTYGYPESWEYFDLETFGIEL